MHSKNDIENPFEDNTVQSTLTSSVFKKNERRMTSILEVFNIKSDCYESSLEKNRIK